VLPALFISLWRKVEQISADGAYGTKACHGFLIRGGRVSILPRKNAALWEEGHPHNAAPDLIGPV